MKLKKLVDVCLNAEIPIKVILHTFYFNGGCEDKKDEELTLDSFMLLKNKKVSSYEFREQDNIHICCVDLAE